MQDAIKPKSINFTAIIPYIIIIIIIACASYIIYQSSIYYEAYKNLILLGLE